MSSNPFPDSAFFKVNPFEGDPFDDLLKDRCSIWKKAATGETPYGQPVERYVPLADDVPCFVEEQSGKELNVPPAPASETSLGVKTFLLFMRPIQVDSPSVNLNNHHFLLVKAVGDTTLD